MEMQARFGEFLLRLAETQFDCKFVRLHGIDRLEYPDDEHGNRDEAEECGACRRRRPAALLQAVLAAADDILEIGRRSLRAAGPARTLPPGAAATAAAPWAAAAAALIIPGHENPFAWTSQRSLAGAPARSSVAIYRDAGSGFQRGASHCPVSLRKLRRIFSMHSFTPLVNGIACRMGILVAGGKCFLARSPPRLRDRSAESCVSPSTSASTCVT